MGGTMTPEELQRWGKVTGGRRFALTLGAGIVCTILKWHGKIDDTTFATVVLGTVGFYISGNTYQKVKNNETSAV